MDAEFSLKGIEDVLAKFKEVEFETRYKGGRFALGKAADVVIRAAKINARRIDDPDSANRIAGNIAKRWSGKRFRTTGDLGWRVGVLGGARQQPQKGKPAPGGDTYYWRFVEFGHIRQNGVNVPARPFLRPALTDNISKASNEFVTHYKKALERAIKRAKKNAEAV